MAAVIFVYAFKAGTSNSWCMLLAVVTSRSSKCIRCCPWDHLIINFLVLFIPLFITVLCVNHPHLTIKMSKFQLISPEESYFQFEVYSVGRDLRECYDDLTEVYKSVRSDLSTYQQSKFQFLVDTFRLAIRRIRKSQTEYLGLANAGELHEFFRPVVERMRNVSPTPSSIISVANVARPGSNKAIDDALQFSQNDPGTFLSPQAIEKEATQKANAKKPNDYSDSLKQSPFLTGQALKLTIPAFTTPKTVIEKVHSPSHSSVEGNEKSSFKVSSTLSSETQSQDNNSHSATSSPNLSADKQAKVVPQPKLVGNSQVPNDPRLSPFKKPSSESKNRDGTSANVNKEILEPIKYSNKSPDDGHKSPAKVIEPDTPMLSNNDLSKEDECSTADAGASHEPLEEGNLPDVEVEIPNGTSISLVGESPKQADSSPMSIGGTSKQAEETTTTSSDIEVPRTTGTLVVPAVENMKQAESFKTKASVKLFDESIQVVEKDIGQADKASESEKTEQADKACATTDEPIPSTSGVTTQTDGPGTSSPTARALDNDGGPDVSSIEDDDQIGPETQEEESEDASLEEIIEFGLKNFTRVRSTRAATPSDQTFCITGAENNNDRFEITFSQSDEETPIKRPPKKRPQEMTDDESPIRDPRDPSDPPPKRRRIIENSPTAFTSSGYESTTRTLQNVTLRPLEKLYGPRLASVLQKIKINKVNRERENPPRRVLPLAFPPNNKSTLKPSIRSPNINNIKKLKEPGQIRQVHPPPKNKPGRPKKVTEPPKRVLRNTPRAVLVPAKEPRTSQQKAQRDDDESDEDSQQLARKPKKDIDFKELARERVKNFKKDADGNILMVQCEICKYVEPKENRNTMRHFDRHSDTTVSYYDMFTEILTTEDQAVKMLEEWLPEARSNRATGFVRINLSRQAKK